MMGGDLGDKLFHNAELSDAITAWRDAGLQVSLTLAQVNALTREATTALEELRAGMRTLIGDSTTRVAKMLTELNATIAESHAIAAKVNAGLAAMGAKK